ncbi:M20/M25/M40 family metallo-hydrolase [Nostocoides sp. F2B08]|uniref:dipeptidase n=1 Tax=Nostocoides sp. F2B08 TaxID=2653936 RepID=UPI001262D803|nr:dipeptidase [Tetrasphaera sp. F2B08]KAB7744053.1 M20/M25/M40 family metallo-hydrolase [Tetrasphaera sp. F2B08]
MTEHLAAAVADHMARARADLEALVAFRSVADERIVPREECHAAADAVTGLFREVGLDVEQVETSDGSRAVLGTSPAPPGAPTVLLYSHYDVQPPGDLAEWDGSPWELVERSGRWYARGAADCKGNLVMLLTALRALPRPWPVGVRMVCDGSEEMSTGGIERLVQDRPELFSADLMLIADSGNIEQGVPTATVSLRGTGSVVVTVRTLDGPVHSGMFGGAAPDALAALVHVLATLRDEHGDTTVDGLGSDGTWAGADYPVDRFRRDAGVLDGAPVLGSGSVADTLWARPAATILAIDAPRVAEATAAVQGTARAMVNLRVPPGQDAAEAQRLLVEHLEAAAPWGVEVEVEPRTLGQPFAARTDGPAFAALAVAMESAFGQPLTTVGQGGAIPLCSRLHEAHPDAEILLFGVEEPACRIHSPGESVDPREIERTAYGLALLLDSLGHPHPHPGAI